MSCSTLYLHREPSGPWRHNWAKYGTVGRSSPQDARRLCHEHHDPLIVAGEHSLVDSVYCRGLLLDEKERVFRFYFCYGDALVLLKGEAASRACRTLPAWAGWDADYAFGGPEELAELAGLPFRGHEMSPPGLETHIEHARPGCTWDPAANVASVPESEEWDWLMVAPVSLLSVVEDDGRSRDHAFHTEELIRLLQAGPGVITALQPFPPALPLCERNVSAGVTIDRPNRTLYHWGPARVPPRWLRALHDAWPGWSLVREQDLYIGQLARTGRSAHGTRLEDLEPETLPKFLSEEELHLLGRAGEGPPILPRWSAQVRIEPEA